MNKVNDIRDRYRSEIIGIRNILNQLEQVKIYEITGSKIDGSLTTHVQKITRLLVDLVIKIEYDEDSIAVKQKEVAEIRGNIYKY